MMQILRSLFNFLDAGYSGLLILFIVLLAVLLFYFLPSVIASSRHKRQFPAIFLLNLFTGWTFVGWIAALIWSAIVEESDYEDIKRKEALRVEKRKLKELKFKPDKIHTQETLAKPERRHTFKETLTKKRSIKALLTQRLW